MKTIFTLIYFILISMNIFGQNKKPIDDFINGTDTTQFFNDSDNLRERNNSMNLFDTLVLGSFRDTSFLNSKNLSFEGLFQQFDKMFEQFSDNGLTRDSTLNNSFPFDMKKIIEEMIPFQEFQIPNSKTKNKKKTRKKYSL